MKSTINLIRSASARSAGRTIPRSFHSSPSSTSTICKRASSSSSSSSSTSSSRSSSFFKCTKKAITGTTLLAAPSFLLAPSSADSMMMYENDLPDSQTANLSNKSSVLSSSTNLLSSPSSLKDSFDAFLHSIEPLICDTRLSVGVSSIPHPAKIAKGGEDAYFLSDDMKVVGVADGVGGWGDIGVDPALYSKSLMEGGKISVESISSRDPVDVMSEAYQYASFVQGSSTCCILVLDGVHVNAANLGDSGFMVIRGLEVVFRTKEQQHSFNFPYQIGTGSADKPHHSQRLTVEVRPGDLIIVGTDGLWDNLFDEDIIEVVANANSSDPATIAQLIARQAHIVANDKDILSPFSKSARQNGYPLATGGKLDDITVIVGRVVLSCVDYGDISGVEPMTIAS